MRDFRVLEPCSISGLLSDLSVRLLQIDLITLLLGSCENFNRFFICEDVLITGEHLKYLLFDLEQLSFIMRAIDDESFFILLEIRSFLLDEDAEQLVVKPFVGDHEVNQRDLRGDLREVVRIPQLRSDVESEVLGVFQRLIS